MSIKQVAFLGAALEVVVGVLGGRSLILDSAPYCALGIGIFAGVAAGLLLMLPSIFKE